MPVRTTQPAAPGGASTPLDGFSPIGAINSWGLECGSYGATPTGGDTWGLNLNLGANRARLIPFQLNETLTIDGFGWINGDAVVSGNLDAGIYDVQGNLLVSIGGVPQGAVSILQTQAVNPTALRSGQYYLALVQDNASGSVRVTNMAIGPQVFLGVKHATSAYPLPAIVTPIDPTVAGYPVMSAFTTTVF